MAENNENTRRNRNESRKLRKKALNVLEGLEIPKIDSLVSTVKQLTEAVNKLLPEGAPKVAMPSSDVLAARARVANAEAEVEALKSKGRGFFQSSAKKAEKEKLRSAAQAKLNSTRKNLNAILARNTLSSLPMNKSKASEPNALPLSANTNKNKGIASLNLTPPTINTSTNNLGNNPLGNIQVNANNEKSSKSNNLGNNPLGNIKVNANNVTAKNVRAKMNAKAAENNLNKEKQSAEIKNSTKGIDSLNLAPPTINTSTNNLGNNPLGNIQVNANNEKSSKSNNLGNNPLGNIKVNANNVTAKNVRAKMNAKAAENNLNKEKQSAEIKNSTKGIDSLNLAPPTMITNNLANNPLGNIKVNANNEKPLAIKKFTNENRVNLSNPAYNSPNVSPRSVNTNTSVNTINRTKANNNVVNLSQEAYRNIKPPLKKENGKRNLISNTEEKAKAKANAEANAEANANWSNFAKKGLNPLRNGRKSKQTPRSKKNSKKTRKNRR